MNPKRCMKCLLHGGEDSHPSHKCPCRDCNCHQCKLVDCRRDIANKIVRLTRNLKLHLRISEKDAPYTCARCRNHGIVVLKKHHTPCPFSLCECEHCNLISERTRIDRELNSITRGHPSKDIILDLITALATDSFDPEAFDYNALAHFFSLPTLLIPEEWAPQMGEITELVHAALRKFPHFPRN